MVSLGFVKGLAAALAATVLALGVQSYRVVVAQGETAECKQATAELRVKIEEANNEALRREAVARSEAREPYERKMLESGPLITGVRMRINDLCMPNPTAPNTLRGTVPGAAGVVDGADPGVGSDRDAEDRRFVEALERDIQYCQSEINRLEAFQVWAKAVACNVGGTC